MLGHLVSNSPTPVVSHTGAPGWFRRLIAFLLHRS
jgi:hypothetical protein